MNPISHPSLKVRRATALDREMWQEWMRTFATVVRLEAHAILPNASGTTAIEPVTQLVVLCDAMRVAFVECTPGDQESELRIFLKPSAWSKISRSSVLAAISAYRQDHPVTTGRPKNQAA